MIVNGAVVIVTIMVAFERDARPVDSGAYLLGALMTLPLLVRRRWPLAVLLLASLFQFLYYFLDYPGITPAPALAVPLYTAVLAGRLRWAVGLTAVFFSAGYCMNTIVEGNPRLRTFADYLPQLALMAVVILLAEVVVSRRELAEETRERLRQAEQEREREAARLVTEERVRIARELHDTVAHSMATITVQAGSALHVLGKRPDDVRAALTAIRYTSKDALREMRATLGLLREGGEQQPYEAAGLDRLPALIDAVRAAGVKIELEIEGDPRPLDQPVDHSAYRIVQESLTNVLRHAGLGARAEVQISYDPGGVTLLITDDGAGGSPREGQGDGGGHGLGGMRERTEAAGGTFNAGPRPGGGFMVTAWLATCEPGLAAPEADRSIPR